MAATPGLMRAAAGEALAVLRAASATHLHLRQRLVAIGLVTFGLSLVCTLLAYLLERNGPGSEIHSLWTAFFWVATQLLTVSSSIKNPVTTGGQILDIFMEGYAITVVASLAGSFGAFFHTRSQERRVGSA